MKNYTEILTSVWRINHANEVKPTLVIPAKVRSQPLPGSYMVMNNCEMLEMRCWNIIRHVQNIMHHKQNVGSVKK